MSSCEVDATSARRKALTLTAMSLGFGVVQLDVTIVNTALQSIGDGLGGGIAQLQWVVSAYTITFAALILSAGTLGDRLGAKKIFLFGFALFIAASLACALAFNATLLIAARALQGIGAAILVPNSLALLNHAYPDERERGRAVGTWAAGASVALTAGPLLGGGLIALAGWRSIFFVNVPIGAAGLWLAWRYAADTPTSAGRALDLPGQLAGVLGLGGLAGAIIEGGALGWTQPWVLAGFIGAAVAVVLFVVRERLAAQPMLPIALFQNRLFALTALIGLMVNLAFYGLIFMLSLYFQQINGFSALATGLAFLPMMAAVFMANLMAAQGAERWGGLATIAFGAGLCAVGCLLLIGIHAKMNYWAMTLQLVAMGAGLGLLVPPLTSTLLGSVEKSRSGVAAGVLNSTRQTGSVLGVALFGSLVGQGAGFIAGARLSLGIAVVMFLAASLLSLKANKK